MRRILSILVMLALALGPAMASIPADALAIGHASGWTGKVDESRLPACCRHNGKHHCAMASTGQQAEAGEKTRETSVSSNDCCPFMPRSIASTAPSVAALMKASSSLVLVPTEARALLGIAAVAQRNELRTWPKRGPPAQVA